MSDFGPDGTAPRGYRPQDPPQDDSPDESWLEVETYSDGANLRVVALECAARVCTHAGAGVGGVTYWNPAEVIAKADAFLAWLEADA